MPTIPGSTSDKRRNLAAVPSPSRAPAQAAPEPESLVDDLISSPAPQPSEQLPTGGSLVDELFDIEETDARASLTLSRETSDTVPPDRARRILGLELKTGIPSAFIADNLDEIERDAARNDFDPSAYRARNPKLAAWFQANPHHFAFAKEDVGFLENIERVGKGLAEGWRNADLQGELGKILYEELTSEGLSPAKAARAQAIRKQMEEIGLRESEDTEAGWAARQAGNSAGQFVDSLPEMAKFGVPAAAAGAGLGALGLGAGALPGAVAGGAAGSALGSAMHAYQLEAGFAFDELRNMKDVDGNPLDLNTAKAVAHGVGVVNAAIEGGSDLLLARLLPGVKNAIQGFTKPAVRQAVKRALAVPTLRAAMVSGATKMVQSGMVEGGEEFIQALVQAAGRETAQGLDGGVFAPDSLIEDVTGGLEQGAAAAVGSGLTFGLLAGGSNFVVEAGRAKKAQQAKEVYQALGAIKDTKELKNLPEKTQEAIAAVTKDGPLETAYVPVEAFTTYFQSQGADPREVAAEIMQDGGKAYDQARLVGIDLAIPMDRYARTIAPNEQAHAFFVEEMRHAPDAMNAREAKAFEEEFEAEANRRRESEAATSETDPSVDTSQDSASQVRAEIEAQLEAAGFNRETIKPYADLWETYYRTRGERMGQDALELFRSEGVQIQREGLESQVPAVPEYDRLIPMIDRIRAGDVPDASAGRGASLLDFIRERGGIKDDSGDLASMEVDGERVPFRRNVIQESGRALDEMAIAAAESGYIAEADGRALLDAIDAELRGAPVYSAMNEDQNLVGQFEELSRLRSQIQGLGLDLQSMDNAEVMRRLQENEGVAADVGFDLFQKVIDAAERFRQRGALSQPNVETPAEVVSPPGSSQKKGKKGPKNDPRLERFMARFPKRSKAASAIKKAQQKDAGPYVNADVGAIGWAPNYAAEPTGEIGPKGISEPNPREGSTRETDPLKWAELKYGATMALIQKHAERGIPLTINTSSDLIAHQDIVPILPEGAVVNMYVLTEDEGLNRILFPGNPSRARQQKAIDALRENGIEVHVIQSTPEEIIELLGGQEIAQRLTGVEGADLFQLLEESLITPESIAEEVRKNPRALSREELKAIETRVDQINEEMDRIPEGDERIDDLVIELEEYAAILESSERLARRREVGFGVVREDGVEYFQGIRGSYNPFTRIIKIAQGGDLSTFLHESAHHFLEEIRRDIETLKARAPESLTPAQRDFLAREGDLLSFLGAESLDKIEREHHETFAETWERYLATGEAPSAGLREAFRAFKAWMIQVYKSIRGVPGKPITPEIREFFDRLIATEEAIAEAQAEMGDATFPDIPDALRRAQEEAQRAAEEMLTGKLIREQQRKKQKEYQDARIGVRAEIASEVASRPVYAALNALQSKGEDSIKLSKAAIVSQYGKSRLAKLPRPYVYTVNGGKHPDTVAAMFGFTSGDELLHALSTAPDQDEVIEALTDERMKDLFGDTLTDGSLSEEAIKSVHNDKKAQLYRETLKWMAENRLGQLKAGIKRAVRPLPTEQTVRDQAERTISEQSAKAIKPHLYLRAEKRAAKESLNLYLKGDFESSYKAQYRAMMNHELYRAAVEAVDFVDTMKDYAKKLATPKRRAVIGKADQEWLAQVDDALARYSFRSQSSRAKTQTVLDWAEAVFESTGERISISPDVLNESRRVYYMDAPVAELRGLYDTLRSIEHVAKVVNKVTIEGKKLEREELQAQLVSALEEAYPNEKPLPETEAEVRATEDLHKKTKGFIDTTWRPEKIIEALDGGKKQGIWHDFLWNRAAEAQYKRQELMRDIVKPLLKVALEMPKDRGKHLDERVFVRSLGQSLSRRTILGVALNVGNESNLNKLMKGGMWFGQEHVELGQAEIDDLLSHLDADDIKLVNEIWATVEKLFPSLDALNRRSTGLPLNKIEAKSVTTQAGVLKGGYWPAVADPRHSRIGEKQADEAMLATEMFAPKYAKAATQHSFRKERTGAVYAINLDWGQVLSGHVTRAATDIAYHEFVNEARRVLESTPVKKAIQNRLGEHVRVMIDEWLVHQVRPPMYSSRGTSPINTLIDGLVSNSAIAALGLNVAVAGKNFITAIPQAWSQTDATAMIRVLPRFLADPKRAYAMVRELSGEMRFREENLDKTFSDIRKEIAGKSTLKARIARFSMMIHELSDQAITVPLWMAKFQQEISNGKTELEAIRLADKMIRTTQIAGAMKDLSAFERDPSYRWAKLFIGPTLIQFNEARGAFAGKSYWEAMTSREVWRTQVSVWVSAAIIWPLLSGRGPDEEDDPLVWAAIQFAFSPFTMMPFIREGADYLNSKAQGERGFTRPHPVADLLITSGEAIDTFLDEDADGQKKLEKALRAIGPATGLPTNQAIKTLRMIDAHAKQ